MKFLTNFLSSGHSFSQEESLQYFRISFLNALMFIATLFTFMNSMASMAGAVDFGSIFEKATLLHVVVSVFVVYSLRVNKAFYLYVANFFILTSMVLFYFVLLTRPEDEFRLVAFYMGLFTAYVLLGKKYGVLLAVFIVASIVFLNQQYDLMLSEFALSTFFTFFIIFAAFLFFFLRKVERDVLEFKVLNNTLKERVIKEKQQRLEQEQILLRQCRLSNMGEMLDSIAHQWRQPLMHVNALLLNMDHAVVTKKNDNKYLAGKIDEIGELTQHMSQTIEDFRTLSQINQKAGKFSLEPLINDVLSLMKNQFFDIKISTNLDDAVIVNGYKTELMQVVIILLSNAVEALNEHKKADKEITLSVLNKGAKVEIVVVDNAGGISKDISTKIFDSYYTTKEQSGSTGLGLYIANIIVKHKMRGVLAFTNTHDGACFTISLDKVNALSS